MDGWKWVISKHFFNAKGLVHHHPIFQAKLMKSGCLFFGFQAEPSVSFWESILKRCHPGSFCVPIAVEIAVSHWTTIFGHLLTPHLGPQGTFSFTKKL